jgi:hypothetical protein
MRRLVSSVAFAVLAGDEEAHESQREHKHDRH